MNENFAMASGDQILLRIRGEYLEMPGLGLTLFLRRVASGTSMSEPVRSFCSR